jgi:hypothetical protein
MALWAVLLLTPPAGALARELPPDLRALFEGFQTYRRAAIGYLRTENTDLAAIQIERLRERWATDRRRLSAAITADAALAEALARTEANVAESLRVADAGDVEQSRRLLENAAAALDAWRKANGVRLFSDCIAELGAAFEQLDRVLRNAPDLTDRTTSENIVALSGRTVAVLDRCEREATGDVRDEPEFRRLVDGMRESLGHMPNAAAARDGALLHRLLIEQRSFERLLAFRYG